MSHSMNEMTWKDIPWANSERPPLPVGEGVKAVVPELDADGKKTGEFIVLEHEDYMRIMGSLAYEKERSDGDPTRHLSKGLPERVPEQNPVIRRKAMLPPGGAMK